MSPVRLNGSTSGYSELSAPAVAGNNTITLPTGAGSANQLLKNGATAGSLAFGTATEDASGNLAFNSGYGSSAVAYGCRAWVNFNGTGTVAIRASGNVSSITDNGVGNYTVNFTTAMPDANYSAVGGYGNDSGSSVAGWWVSRLPTYATGSCQVLCGRPDTGAYADASTLTMAFFR
jgi:hypothetical protein